MLKFRTMVADAEERLGDLVDLEKLEEPTFKIPDDPRVTRARAASCAAPASTSCRSCSTCSAATCRWSGRGPRRRPWSPSTTSASGSGSAVKPGLTGPMQVYGRGDLTFEERLAMERDYLDNLSLAGDLAILLRTPRRDRPRRRRLLRPDDGRPRSTSRS